MFYGWKDNFSIEIKNTVTGKIINTVLKGVEKQTIQSMRKQTAMPSEKPFKFFYLEDINTGLIEYLSFSQMENFKVFLDSTFKFIEEKNIKNLIIDVRNNGGGNSNCGKFFLTYLTKEPYVMFSECNVKYSKKVKNMYKQNIPKWMQIFPFYYLSNNSKILYTSKDGYIHENKTEPYKHDISEPFFSGNVYILIGNYTFSSATDFAAVFKDYGFGILIGEETGGLATCYGDLLMFNMPNSGLSFCVSHKYFVRPGGFDDCKGVIPDYEVKQKPEDIKNGIDNILEFTKELIYSTQIMQ